MSKENGEETYSVIFSALKHPIRRRILRMLRAEEELAYTQILTNLGIDSGHLNYHLENLGELLTKTKQGKYRLSPIGDAALELMSGVEEGKINRSETREPLLSRRRLTIFQIITMGALIVAGMTLMNVSYASTYNYTSSGSLDKQYTQFIQPNSTITSLEAINVRHFPSNTLTTRYRVFFQIDIFTNASLWVQLIELNSFDGTAGPNFQQLPLMLFNETRDGPSYSEQGIRIGYAIRVPLPSPKERGYILEGIAHYCVNITNRGKASVVYDSSGNGSTITLPNYTTSINLQVSYPCIEETDYPYFYHGIALITLSLVTTLLLHLLSRIKQTG